MPTETRAEHMRRCKDRALRLLDRGDLVNAFASFGSDIRKHPETDTEAMRLLVAVEGMRHVSLNDTTAMRRFIEGFAE